MTPTAPSASWILVTLLMLACDPASRFDAGAGNDGGDSVDAAHASDAAHSIDGGNVDAGSSLDAGLLRTDGSTSVPDASVVGTDAGAPDAGAPDTGPPDAGVAAEADLHVHIAIANDCSMTVTPTEVSVPPGQTLHIDWHNHSASYPVNLDMSYGGAYLDLATGATWDETYGHCATPFVGDTWADIYTGCSSHRFYIRCL